MSEAKELRIKEANRVPANWNVRNSLNDPNRILAENRVSGTKYHGKRDLFIRKFLRT